MIIVAEKHPLGHVSCDGKLFSIGSITPENERYWFAYVEEEACKRHERDLQTTIDTYIDVALCSTNANDFCLGQCGAAFILNSKEQIYHTIELIIPDRRLQLQLRQAVAWNSPMTQTSIAARQKGGL